jgi:hypothetical protein
MAGNANAAPPGSAAAVVRPGPPVTIETSQIADWGIWIDGRGAIEGASTEGVGHHLL